MPPLDWIDDELARLAAADLRRDIPAPLDQQGPVVEVAGQRLVNFASNDYLGLASDPRLVEAAIAACRTQGVGRGASPLIGGRGSAHALLEQRLAEFEGTAAALLFPSGFAANAGVVPALVEQGDAIFADAKNHASLIDGCRLSRAAIHVYPHGDLAALRQLLERESAARRKLIATDSLFSMDGDVAPLAQLSDLAQQHDAMLLVDEAHATGVFGAHGRGLCEYLGVEGPHVIRIGTLSKALGAAGGFVCGSRSLIEWLANRARSYVFSTAQPASIAAAAVAALDVVQQEPERRGKLLAAAAQLRRRLRELGVALTPPTFVEGSLAAIDTQIIPLYLGEPAAAVQLSAALRRRGDWVPAIRPPSVPNGQSLLRISLTAAHTAEQITGLIETVGELLA